MHLSKARGVEKDGVTYHGNPGGVSGVVPDALVAVSELSVVRVVAVVLAVWAAGGQLELGVAQVRDALKTEMAVACTPPLGRRGSSRGRGGSGYGTVG